VPHILWLEVRSWFKDSQSDKYKAIMDGLPCFKGGVPINSSIFGDRMRFFVLLLLIGAVSSAQQTETIVQKDVIDVPSRYGFPVKRKSPVQFNYFIDRSIRWKPRLRVAVAVQNDFLPFTRNDSTFISGYEVSVSLRQKESTLAGFTWRESVLQKVFKKTNSQWDYQYHTYVLPLHNSAWRDSIAAGTYNILVDVRAGNSSRRYKATRTFEWKQADSMPIPHTEPVFLLADSSAPAQPKLNPMRDILEYNVPYDAFLRARLNPGDSVSVNIRLYQTLDDQENLVQQQFINKRMHKDQLVLQYRLPMEALAEGHYKLKMHIRLPDGREITPERAFQVAWLKKPVYLYHPDLAIRPMRYLLSEAQRAEIKGMSYKELGVWIEKFWEERDPTPDTRYNELIDVFFERVSEAVRKFSNRFKEGWQTDRGRIYVLYGPPEKIINNRYNTKNPHIIWDYTTRGLEFVFRDTDKDGEFELDEGETNNE